MKQITKIKIFHQFFRWITAFIEIIDALITIITLGFYNPGFTMYLYTLEAKLIMYFKMKDKK